MKLEILEYQDDGGRNVFRRWVEKLDSSARIRISVALGRLSEGNTSVLKSVGNGVQELRIHYGPGYRIYLGREGDSFVILLCGGDKGSQRRDIEQAKKLWQNHKQRRKT